MTIEHPGKQRRDERVRLQVSARDNALIREAASALEVSLSEFLLDTALLRAEQVLADRRQFSLDEQQWESFMELLDRAPVSKPRLATFMQSETVFTTPS